MTDSPNQQQAGATWRDDGPLRGITTCPICQDATRKWEVRWTGGAFYVQRGDIHRSIHVGHDEVKALALADYLNALERRAAQADRLAEALRAIRDSETYNVDFEGAPDFLKARRALQSLEEKSR